METYPVWCKYVLLPRKFSQLPYFWSKVKNPSSSPLESFFGSPQPSVSFIIQDGGISGYSLLAQQDTPALQATEYRNKKNSKANFVTWILRLPPERQLSILLKFFFPRIDICCFFLDFSTLEQSFC